MSWRPIETAPKDGTRIVLCNAKNLETATGRWDALDEFWLHTCSRRFSSDGYFTHWTPLPAAPPIEGTVTDPATAAASQLATGEPKSQNTEGEGREG